MFSPYYAWANAKAPAEAENFCAINIALYGKKGGFWAMTERGRKSLRRDAETLQIGPSSLAWDGTTLTARIEEITVPLPRRLRGIIRVTPPAIQQNDHRLDAAGRHRWQPLAPRAAAEVEFEKPGVSWRGQAYLDTNNGDAPLADDFRSWHWSRAAGGQIFYDVQRRDGTSLSLALNEAGEKFIAPPVQNLPGTLWRVARATRADAGTTPVIVKTLEDAPFYARALISSQIGGALTDSVHESLALDRFTAPWVRVLLPFRMPRFG